MCHDRNGQRTRHLIFVGYSYGGLIVKRALVQTSTHSSFADIAEHTKAALFLGTQHRGTSVTKWGMLAAWALQPLGSSSSLVNESAYDSHSLLDLHREFVAISGKSFCVVNFFEERPIQVFAFWLVRWNQFCTQEQSATYERSKVQNVGLGVDHYGLNKFCSRDHNYQIILQKLREIMKPLALKKRRHLYSIPPQTVISYTERPHLSTAIEEGLQKTQESSNLPHALAIHGLGGTGKTQLALKYVEEHKDNYNPILWIDAKDEESVLSSFQRCAGELQLATEGISTARSALADAPPVRAVLRWLRNREDSDDEWLVVIDNADDFSWGLKKLLPTGTRGNVMVTSQDDLSPNLFDRGCEKVRVDTMEPSEARVLLLQRLEWDTDSAPENVQRACSTIVERLGYLALAVDLAGAYISNDPNQEAALEQYLINFGRHRDELLQNDYFCGLSIYNKTVWTVWDATLERIESKYTGIQPTLLLVFLAHFDHGIIQDELFRLASLGLYELTENQHWKCFEMPDWLEKIIKPHPQEWDDFHYRRALEILARYGLVQLVNGLWPGTTMHGLVKWRANKYGECHPWRSWYRSFILAASDELLCQSARFVQHMAVHLSQITESYLDNCHLSNMAKAFMWATFVRTYFLGGRLMDAEKLCVRAMEMNSASVGEEHINTLCDMRTLASVSSHQKRWTEAEKLQVYVIPIVTKLLGEEHPRTLMNMSELGLTYTGQGRLAEAEELLVRVIDTQSRIIGKAHRDTLMGVSRLAGVYNHQGRWDEAEGLYTRVVDAHSNLFGEEHPRTLQGLANLACVIWHQRRWTEAEKLYIRVIDGMSRVLGDAHPHTLVSMFDLAWIWRGQGREKEASEKVTEVAMRAEQVYGPDDFEARMWAQELRKWNAKIG